MRNKRLLTAKIAKKVRKGRKEQPQKGRKEQPQKGRKEKRNELVKNFRERHIEKRNDPD